MKAAMFEIDVIGEGFLAIMPKPSLDAGLPNSLRRLADAGVDQVVSLLEPSEARHLGLESERLEVKAHAMDFISFPIPDMGVPASAEDYAQIVQMLFTQVCAGINTLVHCRAGIGRSGLLAAGVLLYTGMSVEDAFNYVSHMRGIRVPETMEQHDWLVNNYQAIIDRTR